MDLWVREARLFKYGSGTGSNFSRLRGEGERLSGGGRSSGLMSFLKIGDRAAGAIKSGGTTRRAAKMVVVDADHPDIETYIDWKVKEEQKVAALVTGSKINQKHLKAVMKACVNCEGSGDDCFDRRKNPALRRRDQARAKVACVPANYVKRVIALAKQGVKEISFPVYNTDWNSEAYLTVSGQNSNNSLSRHQRLHGSGGGRRQLEPDRTHQQEDHRRRCKKVSATGMWEEIGYAAWSSRRSGPPVRHHDERLAHLPRRRPADINASNPCSEYMFLDDTACNLASMNLHEIPRRQASGKFDIHAYRHASRLWTITLEISVLMAQFPSEPIAQKSYDYRTLGLGYANLGAYLMVNGIAYDSKQALAICGALTSIMHMTSYATSAEMAAVNSAPSPRYKKNAEPMLRVIRNHRRAALWPVHRLRRRSRSRRSASTPPPARKPTC